MKRNTPHRSSKRIKKTTQRNWSTSCLLEAMECRCLMSGTPLPFGISMAGGVISIVGGDGADTAGVKVVNGQIEVTLSHLVAMPSINFNSPSVFVKATDPIRDYDPAQVSRIDFFGGAGDDSFTNDTAIPCRAYGDAGNDILTGGNGDDQLYGSAGNDRLQGRGGNDLLTGNGGDDTYLFPGRILGTDSIVEAADLDEDALDFTGFGVMQQPISGLQTGSIFPPVTGSIYGPVVGPSLNNVTLDLALTSKQNVCPGNLQLTLSDSAGIEDVTGSAFGDIIKGNDRINSIWGMGGDDRIDGRGGADYLYGGAGNDVIHSSAGSDIVHGDDGNDVLFGDSGNDRLFGDDGNDTLYASTLDQTSLYGGAGDDTLISIGGSTSDLVIGGPGVDTKWLDASNTEGGEWDPAEYQAGLVHRELQYVPLGIDVGTGKVMDLGMPGLTRNGPAMADPLTKSASVVYSDFRDHPLFSSFGPSKDDIRQGDIADGYLMTQLSAIASNNPDHIRQIVVDLGDGTYAVSMGIGGDIRVDGDLPTYNGSLAYAQLGKGNSIWVAIIEKAWAFYRNEKRVGQGWGPAAGQGTYASIENWHPEYSHSPYDTFNTPATETLASTISNYVNFSRGKEFLREMKTAKDQGLVVTLLGAASLDPSTPMIPANLHSAACTYLVDWISDDLSQVRIRNPYGTQGPNGDGYTTISADLAFYCSYSFIALVTSTPTTTHF